MNKLIIGQRIRSSRQQAGLTQAELGSLLGVSRQAISNYETGDSLPKDELKIKLAQILNISVFDLFFLECE